jgi:two-component system, OmpR family, sensor histidine kinase KdpD
MAARPERSDRTRLTTAVRDCLGAVAVATGLVALLDEVAPLTGLGVLYLLAVLFVAIRHGEGAGLATALMSVLAFNFLFIEPRYTLRIGESQYIVALVVFLIAAVVVGRLAADARQRAAEAEARARLALAREREAKMLAEAGSSVLVGADIDAQLHNLAESIEQSTDGSLRVELRAAPSQRPDELAVPLRLAGRTAWLYAQASAGWAREDVERVAAPVARLIDIALEHERVRQQSAEAEGTRQADVVKTALLHAISHDLRSPLTAIRTAASALGDDDLPAADRRELTAVIDEESLRLSSLVDDLLDLSRIQAGAVNPRPDWCDLREVVARAAAPMRSQRAHPVELELPDELPLVRADPTQLERVFSNLIENAAKFSPAGAPVRVTGGAGEGRVTVRVIDRGRGIPLSKRGHVFEPFFRGRGSGQGSGLGLAICRGFVDANGGRIVLQSGSGKGTSFAVSFPLARQPAHVV